MLKWDFDHKWYIEITYIHIENEGWMKVVIEEQLNPDWTILTLEFKQNK